MYFEKNTHCQFLMKTEFLTIYCRCLVVLKGFNKNIDLVNKSCPLLVSKALNMVFHQNFIDFFLLHLFIKFDQFEHIQH